MDALQSFAGEIFADIGFVRASVSVFLFFGKFSVEGLYRGNF